MQKHVNLVDLVKSFPTNIFLQNLASIQKRMSPVKFAHLAEKSGKGSISNLSTKVLPLPLAPVRETLRQIDPESVRAVTMAGHLTQGAPGQGGPNVRGVVLGCLDAEFCNHIIFTMISPHLISKIFASFRTAPKTKFQQISSNVDEISSNFDNC